MKKIVAQEIADPGVAAQHGDTDVEGINTIPVVFRVFRLPRYSKSRISSAMNSSEAVSAQSRRSDALDGFAKLEGLEGGDRERETTRARM